MKMNQFDKHLEVIAQAITIDDKSRQIYTADFDIIRDYVLKKMCNYDHNFKMIFKGPSLFGSYSNNVRIWKPSEFDVHLQLSFPFSAFIIVEQDEDRPGCVNLDFTDVFDVMKNTNGYNDFYDKLDELVDYDNNLLRRGKLQYWIHNIFLNALDEAERVKGSKGDCYYLTYSKRNLAHTIYAKCSKRKISIDFVPAIMFGQKEWMKIRNKHPFKFKCKQWYAVPKSTFGPKSTRKYAFMICCPKVEHDLLLKKQNLKVVFRLLKALRKAYNMQKLKSYFITTIFLWEIEKQKKSFWFGKISDLFIHMLGVLCDYFIKRNLPFFWNKDLNLLDILYDEDINEYQSKLCKACNILITYEYQPNLSLGRCWDHFKLPR